MCVFRLSLQPGREKDTEEAARAYLDQYRIYDVLEELFTSVLFNKPSEPLAFLVGESKRLKSIAGIAKGAVSLTILLLLLLLRASSTLQYKSECSME